MKFKIVCRGFEDDKSDTKYISSMDSFLEHLPKKSRLVIQAPDVYSVIEKIIGVITVFFLLTDLSLDLHRY